MLARLVKLTFKCNERVRWRLCASPSSLLPAVTSSRVVWEDFRTFLGHCDVRLRVFLAMAVVMLNREVSAISGLGGRSTAGAFDQSRIIEDRNISTSPSLSHSTSPHLTSSQHPCPSQSPLLDGERCFTMDPLCLYMHLTKYHKNIGFQENLRTIM